MQLIEWVSRIKPDEQELQTLKSNAQTIKNLLEHNSGNLKIKALRFGGSLAKGTIMKGRLEGDIIFILNKNDWSEKLKEDIVKVLNDNLECKTKIKKIAIETTLKKKIGTLSFDIIPALEINSPKQMADVKQTDFYRGSTTIFQVKYFKQHKVTFPGLEDQVRLMKLWRSSQHLDNYSSFLLELITIEANYRHNLQNLPSNESLIACFKTMKKMLQGSPIYPREWVFSKEDVTVIKNNNLFVIDPGDLSNNVAPKLSKQQILANHQVLSRSIKAISNNEYSSIFH